MAIDILYKDRDLLICRKPPGIPSQPDPSGQESILSSLERMYRPVHLIHRLDTPTGGVMVFGRTAEATASLNALVQDHDRFCKEYLAVLSAPPPDSVGSWRDYLYHDKRANKSYVTDGARKGSKEAILRYRTISSASDGHTLVLVRLLTGRTHQIRVQFAARGLPLCGDGKYGSREKCPYIGLWSYRLSFLHPITGETISVSALPDETMLPWSLVSPLSRLSFPTISNEKNELYS